MSNDARPLNYQAKPGTKKVDNQRAHKQAENRKMKRALKKAERCAKTANQVVFLSPRKKERRKRLALPSRLHRTAGSGTVA